MSARYKIEPDALRGLIADGLSTAAIAIKFGVKPPAVTRACHTYGIPLPQGRVPTSGRNKTWTRTDDERDLGFVRAVTAGLGIQRTADRYGVSNVTVQKVVKEIEAADIAESGEPILEVARHYARKKRGGWK